MSEVAVNEVRTFEEYIAAANQAVSEYTQPIWYRGVGSLNHKLIPSLYRHPKKTTAEDLLRLESEILTRFQERAVPYLTSPIGTPWEYFFLMQHFGVPTRLLDWTENPFIGLFFALSSAKKNPNEEYIEAAAVWVLSPDTWNRKVFSHVSYEGSVMSANHEYLKLYPTVDPPVQPAAIFGIHNSSRIVAQRGVFTIFGKNVKSMKEIYESESFEEDTLRQIVIPADCIEPMFKKMLNMGFTDAVVFPDLEGLARETKRFFGFKV